MEKRRNKFFLAFLTVSTLVIAGSVFLTSSRVERSTPVTSGFAAVETLENDQKAEIIEEKFDYLSPDGKYLLSWENTGEEGALSQIFSFTDVEEKSTVEIFKNNPDSGSTFSVPVNTFSPNGKYVFLEEKTSEGKKHIVLRTDGEDIRTGDKYIEVEKGFYENYPDYKITDVTGWGSYSLLVVNTDSSDGKAGPSWWFDLSNFSFIKLSTRFN